MVQKKDTLLLYFITLVIALTLGMQAYWNYKNYLTSKQQLINEVQISLDNAVATYFTDLAEENILGISLTNNIQNYNPKQLDSILTSIDSTLITHDVHKNLNFKISEDKNFKSISVFSGAPNSQMDTLFRKIKLDKQTREKLVNFDITKDSLTGTDPLFDLTTRVVFAISNDSLKLQKLDTLVHQELLRKKIDVTYDLAYTNEKGSVKRTNKAIHLGGDLSTASKSSYLPENTTLRLTFTNATLAILSTNLITLLLSFLFVATVIGCLLYLLKIIKHQKQLAEVKNDLISNITHEFKTPLATIGAAAEGIKNFNPTNDAGKNLKYANISEEQVTKMTGMVEKLLETATLDSDKLPLNFETYNLSELLERATNQLQLEGSEKKIQFTTEISEVLYPIDLFHFENAINNILDNAVKYGGNRIDVKLQQHKNHLEIIISDTGTSLTTTDQKQIFEKFYRVPKGNTHDVKGFGIGLYYTKKIIEKHQGTIAVICKPQTQFKITLPNV